MKGVELIRLIILFLLNSSILFVLWQRDPSIVSENNLIENMQVVFLFMALFFIFLRFFKERVCSSPIIFFLLFFLTLIMREVDLRPLSAPRFIIILSTKGRDLILSLGWLLFIYAFIRKFKASLKEYAVIVKNAPGRYFVLGCLFYVLAWPFDEGIFSITKNTNNFIEELLENMGTLLFLLSAFYFSKGRFHFR
ncbi:MAG: hypothetical protein IBX72_01445 [Nitrospirae bacterium]|jgi:hypothetical protein|nr:hypothetical protein [Nitrospirota bacterium]